MNLIRGSLTHFPDSFEIWQLNEMAGFPHLYPITNTALGPYALHNQHSIASSCEGEPFMGLTDNSEAIGIIDSVSTDLSCVKMLNNWQPAAVSLRPTIIHSGYLSKGMQHISSNHFQLLFSGNSSSETQYGILQLKELDLDASSWPYIEMEMKSAGIRAIRILAVPTAGGDAFRRYLPVLLDKTSLNDGWERVTVNLESLEGYTPSSIATIYFRFYYDLDATPQIEIRNLKKLHLAFGQRSSTLFEFNSSEALYIGTKNFTPLYPIDANRAYFFRMQE